jgi:hypothetical protein
VAKGILALRTIHARSWLLAVSKRIVWRARRGGQTDAWWPLSLEVAGHARLALLVLRRRSQTWSTLAAASHDALEQIGRTMANGRRRRLRRTSMGILGRATALLQLVTEALDLFLIPMDSC